MTRRWERLARAASGDDYAEVYRQRFADLAARGADMHGEADFVERLYPPPARVLDAGCGAGRVAARLDERGYDVVGYDSDASMIAAARRDHPTLRWQVGDLGNSAALGSAMFDVIVLAGNVVPLLEDGTLPSATLALARRTEPGGFVLAGFGLDATHLPAGCPPVALTDVDAAMYAAGLSDVRHWADWQGSPFDDGGYVVAAYGWPRTTNHPSDRARSH